MALMSLLKIAYKKNYSTRITTNLIKSVRLISEKCEGIWMQTGFVSICTSVIKFLAFQSLSIQFSVISTLISLMDGDWLKNTTTKFNINEHQKMCEQLFSTINLKDLSVD